MAEPGAEPEAIFLARERCRACSSVLKKDGLVDMVRDLASGGAESSSSEISMTSTSGGIVFVLDVEG